MTLGEAQAVAPRLWAEPAEPLRDRALLSAIAAWALRFSPTVEAVEPGTLLLDITGCERLFGGEANLAAAAQCGLTRRGIHARAAIADTVGAAWALAWAGRDAVSVVGPGQSAAALASLPPAVLRIEPRVAEQLDVLGVRSIGDLLMLPRATLPARFGHRLVERLQQALGEAPEPITPHRPEAPPTAQCMFETPLYEAETIRAAGDALLRELLDQVTGRGRALRRVECVVYYTERPAACFSIGLSRGSRSPRHVGELLLQRLERVDVGPGVSGLALAARETSRWRAEQGDLFDGRSPQQEEALGMLLDRLASRLGHGAIVQAVRVEDHEPERAVAETAWGEAPGCAAARRHARVPACLSPALRPLRLLRRPVPIRVMAIVPEGPPVWMYCDGREHRLLRASGPERIETAWWRGPDVRRDYYRVTSETGEQFWVFRARKDGEWRLHGVFV